MDAIEKVHGLRGEWVSIAKCEICGAIYMDCSISAAQKMHDEDEDCEGCSGVVIESPNGNRSILAYPKRCAERQGREGQKEVGRRLKRLALNRGPLREKV